MQAVTTGREVCFEARDNASSFPSPLWGGSASASEPGWGFSKSHLIILTLPPPPDRRFATATLPTLARGRDQTRQRSVQPFALSDQQLLKLGHGAVGRGEDRQPRRLGDKRGGRSHAVLCKRDQVAVAQIA